jgi:hypothetical protein
MRRTTGGHAACRRATRSHHVHHQLNASNVVSDTIDGEVLAIRSDNGTYYSMRGPAATTWTALLTGAGLDEITAAVGAHHGVDGLDIRADIEAFARSLVDELLLVETTLSGAGGAAVAAALPAETRGVVWEAPEFERYTDMRDLLLFDPIHEVEASGWPAVKAPSPE